ncbi:MAG: L-seryl-tRNA(Sec) selenium transferase [Oscillospiraceae bacterium]|nr:L-seryl-tRNA(Sec) selenium transferase [Oscillospiraceae bacterium]
MEPKEILRHIPKVDELLAHESLSSLTSELTASIVRDAVRAELDALRRSILAQETTILPDIDTLAAAICERARIDALPSLRGVINGTGVVLHTNLGRACLSQRAADAVESVARGYSTLEYDVENGCRGSRHSHIETLLCTVTGAEAAMVVNNNAAAVLLILSALGKGGEVITSRGELVEIGGSFRIPEIMVQCGCTLREVGATNKTHLRDYEGAITDATRALLKVHTSNYKIMGFSESVPLAELVELGRKHNLPVIEDLGSGSLVDLEQFGIHGEPTVQQSVRAGVDIISFSGDKLLGGPQAGIIIGRKDYIQLLKKHPLARAMRVDKMTLAALRETLFAYTDESLALKEIPTLSMLAAPAHELHEKAALLCGKLTECGIRAEVVPTEDQVGGGSVPTQLLPTFAVSISPGHLTLEQLEQRMRLRARPIIGRISREQYLLDARTLMERDFDFIAKTVAEVLS